MKRFIENEKGNVIFSVSIFAFILMAFLILFSIIISKNAYNLIIHEAKNDLYLIGRNVVFTLHRDLMGEDIESADYDELVRLVEKGIRETWNLDRNLKNGQGLIKEVEIRQLYFLEIYDRDPATYRVTPGFCLHIVLRIKFMPIMFSNLLERKCEFSLHQDIEIRKMELEEWGGR